MHNELPRPEDRLPILPEHLLRQHRVFEASDTRFRAAARLHQALWREDRAIPIGSFVNAAGKRRSLGSMVSQSAGDLGANFLSDDITYVAARELAYREPGACMDETRLKTNLLSSMTATFNFFAPLKLDLDLATRVARKLWPEILFQVTDIKFEHSPGRGSRRYTDDYTAFDVLLEGYTADGEPSFVAIEVKYSETMQETVPRISDRYAELASLDEIFRDPTDTALRGRPLQQLWREHLLAVAMLQDRRFAKGHFAVVAPRRNWQVQQAIASYEAELLPAPDGIATFGGSTYEDVIAALSACGAADHGKALHDRYLDFELVDGELELALSERKRKRSVEPTPAEPVAEAA